MRLLPLFGCGLLLEAGWLALWPLSVSLSHSALFTTAMLDAHPPVARLAHLALRVVQLAVPQATDAPLVDRLGSPSYAAPAAALAALMLWLAAVYFLALWLLDRRPARTADRVAPAVGIVLAFAVVFQLTLLWLPGLFSQDVFSYVAYGRLAAQYDLNPYIWPPSVLRDPIVPWVAEIWRTYASPYGPVWVNVQWLLAATTGGLAIADQALVYRLLANVLLLANVALAWRLLGRLTPLSPAQRTTALAALAWNPLVLFEVAGNAHNDVLMVTFSLLGLLLLRHSSRGLLSSVAFTLGTLVKYLSGPGLLWVAVASAARVDAWQRRAWRVALIGILALVIALGTAAPWLELPDSLDPLVTETANVGYVNSLPDMVVVLLSERSGVPLDSARVFERALILAAFAIYLVWEGRRVWCDPSRMSVARALARSSLLYVLLVTTSMQTWYLCLPVSVAVALGSRRRFTQLTLLYSALALPALYLSYYLRESTPGWVFLVYGLAPLAVVALESAVSTTRAGARAHVPASLRIRDHEQAAGGDGVPGAVMEEARR